MQIAITKNPKRYIYKEPLIVMMKGSENGGYLSRSAISCKTVALRHWALDPHPLSPQIVNLRGPR